MRHFGSRRAGPALTFAYDEEGRLARATQTATPANGATYAYDVRWRLSSRTVTQAEAPAATTFYVYDLADRLIAEVDASGQTRKEYVWLDELPVAVVDQAGSANPAIYYVAVDHLMRPLRLTAQDRSRVWQAKYAPFGATTYLYQSPAVLDVRFPGQWFQMETGLAYNWHRHYDASTGRYVQPDPLLVDEGEANVGGIAASIFDGLNGRDGHSIAKRMGWQEAHDIIMSFRFASALRPDGTNLFGYAEQNPLVVADRHGLMGSRGPQQGGSSNGAACPAPGEPSGCSQEYKDYLQGIVDSACKPFPPVCRPGDSCGSMINRAIIFESCANARQKINDVCYNGGDDGHQMAYTAARQGSAICRGLFPTCVK